jgi:hypothetical protein
VNAILAQAARGWTIGDIAIAVVIVIAVIAVVAIFVRVAGIPIPQWVWQILGVVVCAFLVILAIRFLLAL